jgi:predicted nucleic acid-binding protein
MTNYEKAVSRELDNIGKSLPEEFYQTINNLLLNSCPENAESGLRAFVKLLGIGASFVFDSNAVQRIIRYELGGGKSAALSALKSGHVTAIAPKNIDREIANHADEMAEDCHVSAISVLQFYHEEIRPYIEIMPIKDEALFEKVKKDIKDKDDAPFVALGLETQVIGIVSQDTVVSSQEGLRAYKLEDVARVHVHCRKRGVVIFLSIMNVIAFFLLFKTFVKLIVSVFYFVKNNPKLILGIVAGLGLVYFLLKDEVDEKIKEVFGEKWRTIKETMNLIWTDLSPYLIAALCEFSQRIRASNQELGKLTDGLPETGNYFRPRTENAGLRSEEWIAQIFLVLKKPLTSRQIRIALKLVGFKPTSKKTIYYEVNKAMTNNPRFVKDENSYYVLR